MKLLFCTRCHDIFKLDTELRRCKCGAVSGLYLDGLNAEYSGETAIPIGFANSSLALAIRNQPESGSGELFTAFVIPSQCDTMRRI